LAGAPVIEERLKLLPTLVVRLTYRDGRAAE
jgi:hypothetical protein